jgi:glucose 1-dehydrogenase
MGSRVTIDLTGQVALVTGGSSGIGAGCAVALGRAGAAVAVNYHGSREGADEVATSIREFGGRAVTIKADVSCPEDVERMLTETTGAFGRLDILVANAGLQRDAPTETMTLADWQRVIDVNLTGQFLATQAAIRQFLTQGPAPHSRALGKVIAMSSVHEVIPWAGHVNYAASKGGVMLLMKSLAQEFASRRIRVNGIAPGAIKTPINESVWSDPDQAQQLLRLIPYRRIGEPEDVAHACVWLASDLSDYVTGTTLFVDGGMTLYPGFEEGG